MGSPLSADLSQVIKLDQSNESYYLNRASCYQQQEHLEAAIKDLSKAIILNPQYSARLVKSSFRQSRNSYRRSLYFLDYADKQSQAYQRVSILIEQLKHFYCQFRQIQIA